ncbi:hypothetical protein GALMADRAFT_208067 [Galerina marginata CBS 339.88]|uniref:Protein kinase domain-containing protein n=1 Tax=Galerina marginata (strain CBS 339.88) TaxID=685588 RepID=A0A067TMY6_GALM3|nr:hypothetical protein GALMADRAFT_208067 [Galerina marginata CBS 339.88]
MSVLPPPAIWLFDPSQMRVPSGRDSFPFRFLVGETITGICYTVQNVLKEGRAYQLLRVTNKQLGHVKVVRVLDRARVSEDNMRNEITWLTDPQTSDGRHAEFIEDQRDTFRHYIFFTHEGRTLKDVLADSTIHLTKRHIREIGMQLIRAVRKLCLDNVALIDSGHVSEVIYTAEGNFVSRDVLRSTKIRILYYGAVGAEDSRGVGVDQYRAPELIYGMRRHEKTDTFSLGCIMFELWTGLALIPPCQPGPLYRRDKTIAFDAVLGPFSDALIRDIRACYRGPFRFSDGAPAVEWKVSFSLRSFSGQPPPLHDLIEDDDALDLFESMLHLEVRQRVRLNDLFNHPFFCASD